MKTTQSNKNTIPNDWQEVKLGDLIDIKHGYAFSGKYITELPTNNILVTPGNFNIGGGFKGLKFKYYNSDFPSDYILNANEIIITMTDLSKEADTLGYPAKIPKQDGVNYLHNQRLGLVLFKLNDINKDFIYWILTTKEYQNFIVSSASGTSVKHTAPTRIMEYTLHLPPLAEQSRIVAVLETWDKAIEFLKRKIEVKKKIKKYLMQELLTGKTRLSGFSGEWQEVKLGEVADIRRGESITHKDVINGSIPVIAGGQQPAYYHNQSNRIGKTITVSGSGAYAGFVDFYDCPIFVSDSISIQEIKLNILFMYYFLKNNQNYIYSLQTGGAQPHIYPKDLGRLKLDIPTLKEEQNAIAQILTTADDEITALETKLSLWNQQKKYLLNHLITGTIRTSKTLI